MKFVSEKIIDAVAAQLEAEGAYEKTLLAFSKAQPAVFSYLFSEDFGLWTEEERSFLLYLSLVIWRSAAKCTPALPVVTAAQIDRAEENNWALLEPIKSQRFRDKADVFFKDYPQEDLLAFAEDALAEDDEASIVTREGREPIFVALKTIIDVLCI